MDEKVLSQHAFKFLGEALSGVFTPLILIVFGVLFSATYIVTNRTDHDYICYAALLGAAATVAFACKCYHYALKEKDLILRTDACYTANAHKSTGSTEHIVRPGPRVRGGKSNKNKEK
ncbi:hypothetical protein [Halodesulfovibrio sp.]|uniref:hypothetical protein n=1 Tax=Halodesulfovibrio sp. TaxID=1912772 RepID=UPI0025BC08D3|nr:hypothetical protein [Halodesulfovibrio sp.]